MAAATEMYSGLIWWIWSDNDSKPGAIWFVHSRLARLGSSQCAPCEGHGGGSWVGYGMIWMETGQQTHWLYNDSYDHFAQFVVFLALLTVELSNTCVVFFWTTRKLSICQLVHSIRRCGRPRMEPERSKEPRRSVPSRCCRRFVKIEMTSPRPNSCFKQFYKLA